MAAIHLAAGPEFSLATRAEASDVDELGHVSNIAYVRWVQDVAKAHSIAVGWDHDAYKRVLAVFVVRRHQIEYLAPAYDGDRLDLTTWVAGWSAAACQRQTRIVRAGDGRELARALTLWAFVSLETGRPRRVPSEIADAFSASSHKGPPVR